MTEEFNPAIHKTKKDGTPWMREGKYLVDRDKAAAAERAPEVDPIEDVLGSAGKSVEQIAKEVARSRSQQTGEQRIAERSHIPLSESSVPTYSTGNVRRSPVVFEYDYDIGCAEELIRAGVAAKVGADKARGIEIVINYDDHTFKMSGAFGRDSGTLKQPLHTIVMCGCKVATLRSAPDFWL